MNTRLITRLAAATLAAAATCHAAQAAPVDVSYTVSGSAGNWTLDFTLGDNEPAMTSGLYFFGVAVDNGVLTGSAPGFNSWGGTWSSNAYYGGSSTAYNDTWIGNYIPYGASESGFLVHTTDATAPTSVQWYAFGIGTNVTSGFHDGGNPGFEGVATTAVPEPANMALMLAGLGGIALVARRRQARR